MKSYTSKRGQPQSFETIADASQFLVKLRAEPITEVRDLLLLQLFIPHSLTKLMEVRWQDFNSDSRTWCLKKGKGFLSNGSFSSDSTIPLSKCAIEHLNEMYKYAGRNEFLFPELLGMTKARRTAYISSSIKSLWIGYFIDPEGFRDFFTHMAYESGHFQTKFAKSVVSGKPNNGSVSHHFVDQMLLEWWGIILTTTNPSNRKFHPI